jgi:hypothetical protein
MPFTHDFQMQFSAGGAETPFNDSLTPEMLLQAMKDQIAVYEEDPSALLTDCEILNARTPEATWIFRAVDNPDFCVYEPSGEWEDYTQAKSHDGFLTRLEDIQKRERGIHNANDGYYCLARHMDKEPLVAVMTCDLPEYVDIAQLMMAAKPEIIQGLEEEGWMVSNDTLAILVRDNNPTALRLSAFLKETQTDPKTVTVEIHHSPRYLREWMEANRPDVELAGTFDYDTALEV